VLVAVGTGVGTGGVLVALGSGVGTGGVLVALGSGVGTDGVEEGVTCGVAMTSVADWEGVAGVDEADFVEVPMGVFVLGVPVGVFVSVELLVGVGVADAFGSTADSLALEFDSFSSLLVSS